MSERDDVRGTSGVTVERLAVEGPLFVSPEEIREQARAQAFSEAVLYLRNISVADDLPEEFLAAVAVRDAAVRSGRL